MSEVLARLDAQALWPDPEPLPGLPAVMKFDVRWLPKPFQAFVADVTERMQCSPDFIAVGLMAAAGSVIGTKVGVYPKAQDDWIEVPNLWGAIVGRPGLLKTPALNEALKPLRILEKQAFQRHREESTIRRTGEIQREAKIKALTRKIAAEAAKTIDTADLARELVELEEEAKECLIRRYETNDTTIEKMGELLNENPNGLLVYRDEITGWLRSLDREGHEQDRAFYLECWNGKGSFTYDRIGRGTTLIENCCVGILGGIQPGPLSQELSVLRQEIDQEILASNLEIVRESQAAIRDRIEHGDVVLVKGEPVRVPVKARDLAVVGGISHDKARIQRNQPTSITATSSNMRELLQQFEELARTSREKVVSDQ